MLRTIALGSAILIQGIYVRTLSDGRMTVKVGDLHFSGAPVPKAALSPLHVSNEKGRPESAAPFLLYRRSEVDLN